ncbi:calcineurin-like phosphoesterase C-terminal domain-containing protein [Marilutibacter chinensis]|uniref:Calcineurin-like phosphoesterase family protein n=1 Tax=Marilutibacter chinensis TaxID=2912247 RepID=A0ABS9HR60_9GAMM|nr:calcineurin-like phosphoesterase family protein [Lysobacter chinensis]MCF7220797.1 calcineurin-like phosphoesterase family protein [Lysobacter chinensis]
MRMTCAWAVLAVAVALAAGRPATARTAAPDCDGGTVYLDADRDGHRDAGEPGLAGVKVSDGAVIVETDANGRYRLPAIDGRSRFVIKPPGHAVPTRANGLPDYWGNLQREPGPGLEYGGVPVGTDGCRDFALWPARTADDVTAAPDGRGLDVLVFGDPQPKSQVDVDYYRRDIVEPLLAASTAPGRADAALGISLGDIVNDDLSLYPAMNAVTARMGIPWLHVPGNHDLDFDAPDDVASLSTFRHHYGPETFAWEEPQASFVVLDDVIYRPGQSPRYVGGLREDQFAFLQQYLARARRDRLLVIAVHIPFFDTVPGQETFRRADRERLFAMLQPFEHVLLLSAHSHMQQQVWHGPDSGWHGANPLHEYNVGATCGSFWSGVKDAEGIPDTTMRDGTPNGHARLRVRADGSHALQWRVARLPADRSDLTHAIALHAPKVLRRGAWPGYGVYANVFMGDADTRVEYRVDGGEWQPMRRVLRADPRVLAENAADDAAATLRGYDRQADAEVSSHLWRGALPTDLDVGVHHVEVRAFDRWQGEQRAGIDYRLAEAQP